MTEEKNDGSGSWKVALIVTLFALIGAVSFTLRSLPLGDDENRSPEPNVASAPVARATIISNNVNHIRSSSLTNAIVRLDNGLIYFAGPDGVHRFAEFAETNKNLMPIVSFSPNYSKDFGYFLNGTMSDVIAAGNIRDGHFALFWPKVK